MLSNYLFYKDYKYLIAPVLYRVFNEVLQTGKWPDTWKNAIITVIAKEGKDPKQCSSYRPISLLNVDQKIFTSIMANRILDILPCIINLDQTGFVKNRFLGDNVRRTLDAIDYARKTKQQMIVLTLDAEKAFDQVSWPFLFAVLNKFGFHMKCINLMKGMYNEASARVKAMGSVSKPFQIKRGVKQGDPLSPQIFAMCIEPLAEYIRISMSIKGVRIQDEEHKLALYADDIIIFLTDIYRGAAKDFGPHEKNLDRAPNTAETFFILIYIK